MKKQVKTTVMAIKKKTPPKSTKAPAKQTREKKQPEEKTPQKKLVSIDELAQLVGVSDRRIRQLQQEGVIKAEPKNNAKEPARYEFARSIIQIVRYYREKSDSRRSSESEEMADEKLRQTAAKRKLDEIKLAQAQGEMHRTADIEKVFGAMFTRLRVNLMALPMGMAPMLRDQKNIPEIAGIIEERIGRALSELSHFDFDTFKKNGGTAYVKNLEKEGSDEPESD